MTLEREREIEQTLHVLAKVWYAHPSLRLCQLIVNVAGNDPFYMNDATLKKALREYNDTVADFSAHQDKQDGAQ